MAEESRSEEFNGKIPSQIIKTKSLITNQNANQKLKDITEGTVQMSLEH